MGPHTASTAARRPTRTVIIEIWNLVFMQNQRGPGGGKDDYEILGPLPQQNIDTGLGIERVACILQGVDNVYETDLLAPVIAVAERLTGRTYTAGNAEDAVRFRVIADHADRGDAHRRRRRPRQRWPRLRAAPAAAPDRPVRAAARLDRRDHR